MRRAGATAPASPWGAGETLRWPSLASGALVVVGAALVVGAWIVVSGKARFGDQIDWVGLAVGGLVLGCLGQVTWLLDGRRALAERARRLLGEPPHRVVLVARRRATSIEFVGENGLRWYHRADCPLAASQGWPVAPRAEHESAGRRPCGVCRP